MLCDGRCKLPTLSLLQSVPVCAVCMAHNHCTALFVPRSPLYSIQVTCYSCVCSFVTAKSLPLNQPNTLCHTSLSHTCHCTLLSYPLHTHHTHSQHTYCTRGIVSLLCMQCVSLPLPPVHSSLHQSLSTPWLTCSRKRCIRSTRGSK